MKRALLVGINDYRGENMDLPKSLNDVQDIADFLVQKCHFDPDEVRPLSDRRATGDEIRLRLDWLTAGAQEGDRLLFLFSGHGIRMAARNHPAGKVDAIYDAICPVDYDWQSGHGAITDVFFEKYLARLPDGVHFTWIADCCYSGQLIGQTGGGRTVPKSIRTVPPQFDMAWRIETAKKKGLGPKGIEKAVENCRLPNVNREVVLIAACAGDDLAEWIDDERPNGVLTRYLLQELAKPGCLENATLKTVVANVTAAIQNARPADGHRYTQQPVLSGSADLQNLRFLG